MSKSERRGYATITLEVPIEVAEWFVANADYLARAAAIAAVRAEIRDTKSCEQKQQNAETRQADFVALGRLSYRLFRQNGGTSVCKDRGIVQTVADTLQRHDVKSVEYALKKFKRVLGDKIKKRRDREIIRLAVAGATSQEIARRLKIGRNTVGTFIKANKAAIWKYASEHPECYRALINKKKG